MTYKLGIVRFNECHGIGKIGMKIIGFCRDECYSATYYELHLWNYYLYLQQKH